MKTHFHLTIFVLLFTSCSKETENIDDIFSNQIDAATSRMEHKLNDSYEYGRMTTNADYLIIEPYMKDEYYIHLHNITDPKDTFNMFRIGRGPNEITGMADIHPYKNGLFTYPRQSSSIWLNDSIYNMCDQNITKIQHPTKYISTQGHAMLNDSTIIARGLFNDIDKQFAILNDKFEVIQYFEEFPKTDAPFSNNDLTMGFQGNITPLNPSMFIFTGSNGSILKFFEYKNGQIKKLCEYIFSIPEFKSLSQGELTMVGLSKNNVVGCISASSSKKEYYVLHSNEKYIDNPELVSNSIYCFGSEGEPTRKITLDREVQQIAYSKRYNKLYALGTENDRQYFYEITL